jgi:hypothetical protein
MSYRNVFTAIALGFVLSASAVAGAQTPPPPPPPPPAPPAAPAVPVPPAAPAPPPGSVAARLAAGEMRRVDLVLSRWVGDKRIESLPFSVLLAAAVGAPGWVEGRVRLGLDVPSGRTRTTKTDASVTTDQVQTYVGTNIDTTLREPVAGLYDLDVRLTHTMLTPTPRTPGSVAPGELVAASTRTISFNNKLMLREGRTMQVGSGVDAVTGETARLEVTVTTAK